MILGRSRDKAAVGEMVKCQFRRKSERRKRCVDEKQMGAKNKKSKTNTSDVRVSVSSVYQFIVDLYIEIYLGKDLSELPKIL